MNAKNEDEVCEECIAAKEKSMETDASDAHVRGCRTEYARVEACMKKYEGKVTSCTKEWQDFKECFARNGRIR